jgi:hypothetical protein
MVNHCTPFQLYRYYAVLYVPNIEEEIGITIAVVALSSPEPFCIAFKQIPFWNSVMELDSRSDIRLLRQFLKQFSEAIRLNPQCIDQALQWNNCIRILPRREFSTSDVDGTLSLVADAEFRVERI